MDRAMTCLGKGLAEGTPLALKAVWIAPESHFQCEWPVRIIKRNMPSVPCYVVIDFVNQWAMREVETLVEGVHGGLGRRYKFD